MEAQAGSCEPCKRKKCKCDRQRPHCGQCAFMTPLCKYSENNKRGIPGGYLSTLEQRLCDTEAALHDVITELHAVQENPSRPLASRSVRLNSARPSKITKTSRLAEWAKYPLKSPEDVERWWIGVGERDEDYVVLEAPVSFSSHPDPPILKETSEDRQRTTFDHGKTLLRSEIGIPHPIKPTYPSNITVSSENEVQRNIRPFPYTDDIPTGSISRGAIDHNDPGALINNIGISPQMDSTQNQAREWQPSPGSGSNTQSTHLELDESLTLSKHLSNTKPDMYY